MGEPRHLPILLFNDECAVCRLIAGWVCRSLQSQGDAATLIVQPIGNDPAALRALNPSLDIWDAYANIHLIMPDGSMKVNGEAVAETLRRTPVTRWLAPCFNWQFFGRRPLQAILNVAYSALSDIRPLLGCESCGIPPLWLRPFHWMALTLRGKTATRNHSAVSSQTIRR